MNHTISLLNHTTIVESVLRNVTLLIFILLSSVFNIFWIFICLQSHTYRQYLFFLLMCEHAALHLFDLCLTLSFMMVGSIQDKWMFNEQVCRVNAFSPHFVDGALLHVLLAMSGERAVRLWQVICDSSGRVQPNCKVRSRPVVVGGCLLVPLILPFGFALPFTFGMETRFTTVYSEPRYSCVIGDYIELIFITFDAICLVLLPLTLCIILQAYMVHTYCMETHRRNRLQNQILQSATGSEEMPPDEKRTASVSTSARQTVTNNHRGPYTMARRWRELLWGRMVLFLFLAWLILNGPHLAVQYLDLFHVALSKSRSASITYDLTWPPSAITALYWARFYYGLCAPVILFISRPDLRIRLKRICCRLCVRWKRRQFARAAVSAVSAESPSAATATTTNVSMTTVDQPTSSQRLTPSGKLEESHSCGDEIGLQYTVSGHAADQDGSECRSDGSLSSNLNTDDDEEDENMDVLNTSHTLHRLSPPILIATSTGLLVQRPQRATSTTDSVDLGDGSAMLALPSAYKKASLFQATSSESLLRDRPTTLPTSQTGNKSLQISTHGSEQCRPQVCLVQCDLTNARSDLDWGEEEEDTENENSESQHSARSCDEDRLSTPSPDSPVQISPARPLERRLSLKISTCATNVETPWQPGIGRVMIVQPQQKQPPPPQQLTLLERFRSVSTSTVRPTSACFPGSNSNATDMDTLCAPSYESHQYWPAGRPLPARGTMVHGFVSTKASDVRGTSADVKWGEPPRESLHHQQEESSRRYSRMKEKRSRSAHTISNQLEEAHEVNPPVKYAYGKNAGEYKKK